MHETCTKAVKGMPQCKNSLANCANSRAVAGMSITGWKQGCNMAVTGRYKNDRILFLAYCYLKTSLNYLKSSSSTKLAIFLLF